MSGSGDCERRGGLPKSGARTGAEPHASIAVVVCAAARLYREGLEAVLTPIAGVTVAGTAGALEDCIAVTHRTRSDVVLVDASFNGAPDTIRVLAKLPGVSAVVALAVPQTEDAVMACVEAGAAAFVTVDQSIDDLVQTLSSLVRGEVHASPRLTAALLRRISDLASARYADDADGLTRRELQIAGLLGDGLSNKEIARHLQIEPATVKNHVHAVLAKLRVARRAQVGPRLRELGLPR